MGDSDSLVRKRIESILDDAELRGEIQQKSRSIVTELRPSTAPSARITSTAMMDFVASSLREPDLELREIADTGKVDPRALSVVQETIVLTLGRPVLGIRNNRFDFDLSGIGSGKPSSFPVDPESKVWRKRLDNARGLIEKAIPAVGRINLRNHPTYDWVGTGWLVAEDVIVTNRHVAIEFAGKNPDGGSGLGFLRNFQREKIAASIDFRKEYRSDASNEFSIVEVLYIEQTEDPDLAFFRIAKAPMTPGGTLPQPVPLETSSPTNNQQVVVIGYPARDSRIPDPEVVRNIFGDIYDVKRLAPGTIQLVQMDYLEHDASTLGGNSGSLVLEMQGGKALGIHFSGSYRRANYAVPAATIIDRMSRFGASPTTAASPPETGELAVAAATKPGAPEPPTTPGGPSRTPSESPATGVNSIIDQLLQEYGPYKS